MYETLNEHILIIVKWNETQFYVLNRGEGKRMNTSFKIMLTFKILYQNIFEIT